MATAIQLDASWTTVMRLRCNTEPLSRPSAACRRCSRSDLKHEAGLMSNDDTSPQDDEHESEYDNTK